MHVVISVSPSRHFQLFRLSLCLQMAVSRHGLSFGGLRAAKCLFPGTDHRFCALRAAKCLFPRHRRRPAVMVGGYGTPLWWALCFTRIFEAFCG